MLFSTICISPSNRLPYQKSRVDGLQARGVFSPEHSMFASSINSYPGHGCLGLRVDIPAVLMWRKKKRENGDERKRRANEKWAVTVVGETSPYSVSTMKKNYTVFWTVFDSLPDGFCDRKTSLRNPCDWCGSSFANEERKPRNALRRKRKQEGGWFSRYSRREGVFCERVELFADLIRPD
jgi:hypothetical protein